MQSIRDALLGNGASAREIADNVEHLSKSAEDNAAVAQRNGILAVALVLTQAASRGTNETVSLYQEVQVDNTP